MTITSKQLNAKAFDMLTSIDPTKFLSPVQTKVRKYWLTRLQAQSWANNEVLRIAHRLAGVL